MKERLHARAKDALNKPPGKSASERKSFTMTRICMNVMIQGYVSAEQTLAMIIVSKHEVGSQDVAGHLRECVSTFRQGYSRNGAPTQHCERDFRIISRYDGVTHAMRDRQLPYRKRAQVVVGDT